jgi:tRNA-specific 2-thiouridylase
VPATVFPLEGERAKVVFDVPQTAIAPGQVVTVYEEEVVMGGGWIQGAIESV